MSAYIIHNGKLLPADQPVLTAGNRSYRYGYGLFETLRAHKGRIPLQEMHLARLFQGLNQLQFKLPALFSPQLLLQQTERLLHKHGWENARIRISVYPGDGGIMEEDNRKAGYLIECWPLPATLELNQNGLHLGIYNGGRKSCDALSSLKSSSALIYGLAALHAGKNHWNDAIVLNQFGRAADSSIANLFWCHQGQIFTTPLSEGAVAGVMRRYLLENHLIHEQPIEPEMLAEADEVFLTNAIRGIQWVSQVGNKSFPGSKQAALLHQQYIMPLFS